MARKTIVIKNLENGYTCQNCGFSYRKFTSREEKAAWDSEHPEFVANTCGSRLRKKPEFPRDETCEHWYDGTETFSADSKGADSKLKDDN